MPISESYNCILVVVDRFFKYVHFLPLKQPFHCSTECKGHLGHMVRLHGMPKSINWRTKFSLAVFGKRCLDLATPHEWPNGLSSSDRWPNEGQSMRWNVPQVLCTWHTKEMEVLAGISWILVQYIIPLVSWLYSFQSVIWLLPSGGCSSYGALCRK
jgi:hypothetical protein